MIVFECQKSTQNSLGLITILYHCAKKCICGYASEATCQLIMEYNYPKTAYSCFISITKHNNQIKHPCFQTIN